MTNSYFKVTAHIALPSEPALIGNSRLTAGESDDELFLFPGQCGLPPESGQSGRMANGSQNQSPGLIKEQNDEP